MWRSRAPSANAALSLVATPGADEGLELDAERVRDPVDVVEVAHDLGRVVERLPRLRFLMPIRNPLDCALSNVRKGHHKHFANLRGASMPVVIDFMVELVAWALELQERHPELVELGRSLFAGRPLADQFRPSPFFCRLTSS